MDQDQCLLELSLHVLGVGHEVRAEEASVELHAFDDVDVGLEALALFNRDHAVLADLVEGFGHDLADFTVVVRRDRSDRCDATGDLRDRA